MELDQVRQQNKAVLEDWEKTANEYQDLIFCCLKVLGYWPTAEGQRAKDTDGLGVPQLIKRELEWRDKEIARLREAGGER